MTTYYDGCILGVKCMDKKVVATIFSSYGDYSELRFKHEPILIKRTLSRN